MKKYKAAIIGCGRIAGYLEDDPLRMKPCTHVGAYKAYSEIDIVACVSSDLENARAFAEKFAIPNYYADAEAMLKAVQPDIVSITTHADLHAMYTIISAKAGVKAIWCEKAMATSLNEADEMIRVCQKNRTLLVVNHTRRWEREYLFAQNLIKTGGLGTVQTCNAYFSGNIIHTGTHMYDVLGLLFGDPVSVSAEVQDVNNSNAESSGFDSDELEGQSSLKDAGGQLRICFSSGTDVYVHAQDKKFFIFELDIIGDKGRLRLGNGLLEYWYREKSERNTGFYELRQREFSLLPMPNAFAGAVADILRSLQKKRDSLSPGTAAVKALEVAVAAFYSHFENKGNTVYLPLKDRSMRIISR